MTVKVEPLRSVKLFNRSPYDFTTCSVTRLLKISYRFQWVDFLTKSFHTRDWVITLYFKSERDLWTKIILPCLYLTLSCYILVQGESFPFRRQYKINVYIHTDMI